MKRRRTFKLIAIVLALVTAVNPTTAGQWVCASDGTPCPPGAHADAPGRADRCCCGSGFQPLSDCCGHERPGPQPGSALTDDCDDSDVYVNLEKDLARSSQPIRLRTVASILQRPPVIRIQQATGPARLVATNETAPPQFQTSQSHTSRAPPSL